MTKKISTPFLEKMNEMATGRVKLKEDILIIQVTKEQTRRRHIL